MLGLVRGFVALALVTASVDAGPSVAIPDARRGAMVARAGDRVVTVGEVEDRLAALWPAQRATYGATAESVRKRFVDEVIVPELALEVAAKAQGLDRRPVVASRLRRALSEAAFDAVRTSIGDESSVTAASIAQAYEAQRGRFVSPARLKLSRVLCTKRDEAEAVLAEAKKKGTPHAFQDLARDHSIDKATNLRGGDLGMVDAATAQSEFGLHIDPAVVKAAAAVTDGALVPNVVVEGDAFAVVWRRGSIPERKRTLDEATPTLRRYVHEDQVEAAERALIERLRAEKLKSFDPEGLAQIETAL